MGFIDESKLDPVAAVGGKVISEADLDTDEPRQVRERLGNQSTSSVGSFLLDAPRAIASEFVEGVGKVGSGIKRALTGQLAPSTGSTLQDVLNNPAVQTVVGAAQALGAPLAPVSNAITVGAEKVNDALAKRGLTTTADVVSGLGESVANVLAPAKIAKVAGAAKPGVQARFASGRTKAAQAVKEADDALASTRSGLDAAEESFLSFADAAKRHAPKPAEIRARLAQDAPTGEQAGEGFRRLYASRLGAQKTRFNNAYAAINEEGAATAAAAEGYTDAFNRVLGERGISRPLPTRAERAAGGAQAALAVDDEVVDQVDALRTQIDRAANPASRRMAQDALDEYLAQSDIPQNPTVADLIKERQRLSAGERVAVQAKDDNLTRQFKTLIKGLDDDIEAASPELFEQLQRVNQAYRDEFVPLFGKKAATRAIAEGEASTVVDAIIKPASNKKAVEIADRSFELIGRDRGQREAVRKAFINKGVEDAFSDGVFKPSAFTKWWDTYANPTGNNNRVLRTALGDAYDDTASIVNTLKSVKPKEIDSFTQETIANLKKRTAVKEKEIVGKLKADIEQFMGKPTGSGAGQYIGQMAIFQAAPDLVFGNIAGAAVKATAGGVMLISRPALLRFMEFKRGRSLFKAMARATPGTVQASALARQASQFFEKIEGEEN